VEIARALATAPKFILLDEPFAGVDPISVGDIKQIIHHLKAKGIGVLFTDHNVRETLDICETASSSRNSARASRNDRKLWVPPLSDRRYPLHIDRGKRALGHWGYRTRSDLPALPDPTYCPLDVQPVEQAHVGKKRITPSPGSFSTTTKRGKKSAVQAEAFLSQPPDRSP
jgi:energy-coupling factor transporter ATP-binding protein EcfA2